MWMIGDGSVGRPGPPPFPGDGALSLRSALDHRAQLPGTRTKIVQGWPKLWANFRALIGNFSQPWVNQSLAIWANPVHFSFEARDDILDRRHYHFIHSDSGVMRNDSMAIV
jgi:hypothetical protein